MTSFSRPDRTIEPLRDLSIEGFARRSHSHRQIQATPCTEERILGSNILRDPGFEFHDANVPIGPALETMPGSLVVPSANLMWRDGDDASFLSYITGWANEDNNYFDIDGPDTTWRAITTSPRTGTWHGRVTRTLTGQAIDALFVIGAVKCSNLNVYSARVAAGDLITFSVWIKVSVTTDNPKAGIIIETFDEAEASTGVFSSTYSTLTTGYQQISFQAVVPANSYWALVNLDPIHDTQTVVTDFDADDCVLAIT